MPICLITESTGVGRIGVPVMLPGATQKVTYAASVQSVAFGKTTRLIRVIADADVYLAFGLNPTATATAILVPSGTVEYFAVNPLDEVACYDGTT